MLARLTRGLFGRTAATGVHECRHCGTTVEPRQTACPVCGSTEIAHYDV